MCDDAKIADVFHSQLYTSKMWTAKVGIFAWKTGIFEGPWMEV
jgi:hypothetical protein